MLKRDLKKHASKEREINPSQNAQSTKKGGEKEGEMCSFPKKDHESQDSTPKEKKRGKTLLNPQPLIIS